MSFAKRATTSSIPARRRRSPAGWLIRRGVRWTVFLAALLSLPDLVHAAPGARDPSFGWSGVAFVGETGAFTAGGFTAIAEQPDGRIVAAGIATPEVGARGFALARFHPGGGLDPSFGSLGGVELTQVGRFASHARALALQSDGKIVLAGNSIAGTAMDFALARYDTSGRLDATFAAGGTVLTDFGGLDDVEDVVLQPDGKILATGYTCACPSPPCSDTSPSACRMALARYLPNGSLDASFGIGGRLAPSPAHAGTKITSVALQADGKIVTAGPTSSGFFVARHLENGSVDPSFGIATPFSSTLARGIAADVALQGDGKIVVAAALGWQTSSTPSLNLARFLPDGRLDASFGTGGLAGSPSGGELVDLAIQRDGRIVAAVGRAHTGPIPLGGSPELLPDSVVRRYTSAGALDSSFGSGGEVQASFTIGSDSLAAVSLQRDGRILVAGFAYVAPPAYATTLRYFTVARLLSGATCGNGMTESGEECDDGGTFGGDGCSAACTLEGDRDADGLLDAPYDWCVNVAGAQDFLAKPTPKLTIKGISAEEVGSARYRSMTISGELQMPAGFDFASFDPNAVDTSGGRGIQVIVTSRTGSQRWGTTLAGVYAGAGTLGWVKSGRTWTYRGMAGRVAGNGGVVKLTLTDRGAGRVRVSASVRDGAPAYAIGEADLPLRATVVLGRREGAAQRGECGEARFVAGDCRRNAAGTTVSCKG